MLVYKVPSPLLRGRAFPLAAFNEAAVLSLSGGDRQNALIKVIEKEEDHLDLFIEEQKSSSNIPFSHPSLSWRR